MFRKIWILACVFYQLCFVFFRLQFYGFKNNIAWSLSGKGVFQNLHDINFIDKLIRKVLVQLSVKKGCLFYSLVLIRLVKGEAKLVFFVDQNHEYQDLHCCMVYNEKYYSTSIIRKQQLVFFEFVKHVS